MVVVVAGVAAAWALNEIDKYYGITPQVIEYLEKSQQEMITTARKLEDKFWDLTSMFADGLLDTGKKVIESELKRYVRHTLQEVMRKGF